MIRRLLHLTAAAWLLGALISCATKKEKTAATAPTVPAPTPEAHYTTHVSVESGGTTEQVITPVASPTPSPSPSSTPNPKAAPPLQIKLRPTEGFLTRIWHKVFPKKEAPPAATSPIWIGTIKLVNEHDGYALIDSQSFFTLPPGETLNSVGADSESGVLRVTTDRTPPFFIADIVGGKPRAGDRVYSPKP